MHYEALYGHDGDAEERPPSAGMLGRRGSRATPQDGAAPGNVSWCAFGRRDEPVVSSWERRFPAAAPGCGDAGDDVPELAIAVRPGLEVVAQRATRTMALGLDWVSNWPR